MGRSVGLPDIHSGYGFAIGNMAAFDMDVSSKLSADSLASRTDPDNQDPDFEIRIGEKTRISDSLRIRNTGLTYFLPVCHA